ncbi:MAG: hypothetical protein JRN37_00395 [Nitrososphaerota archaeon]|nr:hypothetical protein [Nitrososphaerota archaeon]
MTNWPEYNKKLVNEIVDVFVNTDLLVDQEKQLKRMNRDKRGRPYSYSDALMLIILGNTLACPTGRLKGLPRCSAEYGEQGYRHIPRSAAGRRSSMCPLV